MSTCSNCQCSATPPAQPTQHAENPLADQHRANYEWAHAGWEACKGECDRLRDELAALAHLAQAGDAGEPSDGERSLTIYIDGDPIDVTQFYRAKGFEKLPPTPTMTGSEIRACGWRKQDERQMFIDHGNTGAPMTPVGTNEAVILTDGMRFFCIPHATKDQP